MEDKNMSERNLFDSPLNDGVPEEIENENENDDFFDKIEAVEIDYSVLGESVVNGISFWSASYLKKIEYYDDLKKFKEAYWEQSRVEHNHYFEETAVVKEDLEEKMLSNILNMIRSQFSIDTTDEMKEALTGIDYGNKDTILDILMKYTNSGNTSDIKREQQLQKFAKHISAGNYNIPVLKKTKIQIPGFYYVEKCSIFKEHAIKYSSSNWGKDSDWSEAIRIFAEEHNLETYYSGDTLFQHYSKNEREKHGAFETQVFEDSVLLESLKLFKNGKMELKFVSAELAQLFFDEWITPARNM